MSGANDDQSLKDCEAYVQQHGIQQILKECIVQVFIHTLTYLPPHHINRYKPKRVN